MIDDRLANRSRPAVQARGEDTRRRILETALDLFAAQGYEGTSTRQIAEGAAVNLPAIQYYFGSKEGLYRAIIDDICAETDREMASVAPRVRAALDAPDTPRETFAALLGEVLETFVVLVTSGTQVESRRLIFARAEIEQTPGLDILHENGMRQIFDPCLGLLSRLHGKPTTDREMTMRTLALIGQVVIFCNIHKKAVLDFNDLDEESVRLMKLVVREHTEAVCRAALAAPARG
ncbi:CerR family C-terminal domain-containing protein [Reyranella sp.]|uniref:CerR family C-terminal domain-containing protein n=1 Tax=Reyranella sp. TaxID=1929291 RepID=UPI003BAD1B3E